MFTPNLLRAFKNECVLHLSLRHPNIVSLLGVCFEVETAEVLAVLEYCSRGTLEGMLDDPPARLTWALHKLPIAAGVACGMAYLHSQTPPVLHRDLKPSNILIDGGLFPKISDFGLSREAVQNETMTAAGTPIFSAPELCAHAVKARRQNASASHLCHVA